MSQQFEMIREHLSKAVPFATTVGVILEEVGPGIGKARLEQRPETSNHIGSQHAGAMFTLGEAASGAALAGTIAPVLLQSRPVAKDANISYKKIAKGTLHASAQTNRDSADILSELKEVGKVVFDIAVSITDADGDEVVHMSVNWHVKSNASG